MDYSIFFGPSLETDEIIQKTIRKNFASRTVLTIVHRSNTVIDADKILVLDAGKVSEYDHPYILLKKPDIGIFSNMTEQTVLAMANVLRAQQKNVITTSSLDFS